MTSGSTYYNSIFDGINRQYEPIPIFENQIKFEKCQLFNDYSQSLTMIIFDTYLGDDMMSKDDKENHFEWCWNKNVNNFKEESIIIDGDELKSYFKDFMFETFYLSDIEKNEKSKNSFSRYWSYVFSFNSNKSEMDLFTLKYLYNIFEKSIINEYERVINQ